MTVRPTEIATLADALVAAGKVRIPLSELRLLWSAAAPRLVGDRLQTTALAAALNALRERGVVQLPARAWDTSTSPPLPRSVTVPLAHQADRRHPWTRFPWCSELGWVASLTTLSDARFNDLVAINTWLAQNRGDRTPGAADAIPVRASVRRRKAIGDNGADRAVRARPTQHGIACIPAHSTATGCRESGQRA